MPELGNFYNRKEVHDIFRPGGTFIPQAGAWGLQGVVRISPESKDWVFFVTYGAEQAGHDFDESVTNDGVLSWQSQPSQNLDDSRVLEWINHNENLNDIHLFLRTRKRLNNQPAPYCYLGKLAYITHDNEREEPVHFQWQLLSWPAPDDILTELELNLIQMPEPTQDQEVTGGLTETDPPTDTQPAGVNQTSFTAEKSPINTDLNKLGLKGELLVIEHEKQRLHQAGRDDLANKVEHISVTWGDSAGYDILSFNKDGTTRHIEVKTTTGGLTRPFFISPNELRFSKQHSETYSLYRLYSFSESPDRAQLYILQGDMNEKLQLTPSAYRATYPRSN